MPSRKTIQNVKRSSRRLAVFPAAFCRQKAAPGSGKVNWAEGPRQGEPTQLAGRWPGPGRGGPAKKALEKQDELIYNATE